MTVLCRNKMEGISDLDQGIDVFKDFLKNQVDSCVFIVAVYSQGSRNQTSKVGIFEKGQGHKGRINQPSYQRICS